MPSYAKLTRDHPLDDCTLGTIIAKGEVFYSLEPPEKGDGLRCIPAGYYHCRYKPKSNNGLLTDVYEVLDVPGHAGILLHVGNTVKDTHGCILVALGREIEQKTLVNSKVGMKQFIDLMGSTFDLLVEERVEV